MAAQHPAQALAAAAQALAAAARQAAPPPLTRQSPVDEAAQAALNKSSKLEVARQAVLTQDLQALAAADRAKVKRLEDKLLFPGQPQAPAGDDVGDIIVCDDYHTEAGGNGKVLPTLALAGALAATGVVAWLALRPAALPTPVVPAATAPAAQQFDAVYEQQQKDGTWKEVRRERLKP